jgi:heme/copper-type cytochrome/quinol oxidase subunit 3
MQTDVGAEVPSGNGHNGHKHYATHVLLEHGTDSGEQCNVPTGQEIFAAGSARAYLKWLLATLGLGVGFLVSQLVGWRELSKAGVYFSGHPRSTFFYLATALHGGHLLGGIGLVVYLVIRRLRPLWPLQAEKNTTWTRVVGLYWHMMDGIWIWLFVLLLIFK